MKKLFKTNPIFLLIGVLGLMDTIFLVVSIIVKSYDAMFIAMLISCLVVLLIINVRSSSIYKDARTVNPKDVKKIEQIKKRKSDQKYYWFIFLSQTSILVILYIIISNIVN